MIYSQTEINPLKSTLNTAHKMFEILYDTHFVFPIFFMTAKILIEFHYIYKSGQDI